MGLLDREDGAAENLVALNIRCADVKKVSALAGRDRCIERADVRGGHLDAINGGGD